VNGRQVINQNSYIVVSGLVLLVAAYFVAQFGSLATWLVWIAAVLALYLGFRVLRPGRGSQVKEAELEKLVGSGMPVVLLLFSNY
jgi:uncharacterized membrane protein